MNSYSSFSATTLNGTALTYDQPVHEANWGLNCVPSSVGGTSVLAMLVLQTWHKTCPAQVVRAYCLHCSDARAPGPEAAMQLWRVISLPLVSVARFLGGAEGRNWVGEGVERGVGPAAMFATRSELRVRLHGPTWRPSLLHLQNSLKVRKPIAQPAPGGRRWMCPSSEEPPVATRLPLDVAVGIWLLQFLQDPGQFWAVKPLPPATGRKHPLPSVCLLHKPPSSYIQKERS